MPGKQENIPHYAVSSVQIANPNRLIAKLFINYIVEMRAAKKRKVNNEGRTLFYRRGQLQYALFAKINVAVLKEYIRRYFDTNHANYHSSLTTQQREVTSQKLVANFWI